MKTAFLFQLRSTAELKRWIHNFHKYLHSDAVQIIVITNMKRFENGVIVPDAGANAIKLVRK